MPQSENIQTTVMDLTFIGSGISTSYTLIPLLKRISPTKQLRIAIVEKHDELHTGLAYGTRSGFSSLLITSLSDFLPEGEERDEFIRWLSKNKAELIEELQRNGGELSENWIHTHASEIDMDEWQDIYIPRRFFGSYIKNKTQQAIDEFTDSTGFKIEFITDEALDVEPTENGYKIYFKNHLPIETSRVVLSVGIPPISHVWTPMAVQTMERKVCLISDPYNPSLETNLSKIENFLSKNSLKPNVLIVGANASAMELIYKLNDVSSIKNRINNYYILSPQGELPNSAKDERTVDFEPQYLMGLEKANKLTALKIYEAANQDLDRAESLGYGTSISEASVSKAFTSLLTKLNAFELKEFACHYGNEIGKRQRRAGKHYTDVVDKLRAEQRLSNIKGYYVGLEKSASKHGIAFHYKLKDGELQTSEMKVSIIVNCMGSKTLHEKSISPLLDNLMARKLAVPNESYRGFVVNASFESASNLYIMGPLLAGNLINLLPLWHIEHCGRIIYLGETLAQHLSKSLEN